MSDYKPFESAMEEARSTIQHRAAEVIQIAELAEQRGDERLATNYRLVADAMLVLAGKP